MVIQISRGIASIRSFHLFYFPDIFDLELGVVSVMVNDTYLWMIPYSQHCFLLKHRVLFAEIILCTPVQKMLHHPWSYRIIRDENPISLKWICVSSYLCLTKALFETSFKSFQYNTKGLRLSNYSIKLILCSHSQNKKHGLNKYTKGGHFCAAHITWIFTRL